MSQSFALAGKQGVFTSLAQGQLPNAKGTLYTATSPVSVKNITLVATDTAAHTVNIYLKISGGTSRRLIPKDLPMDGDDPNKAAQVECLESILGMSVGDLIEGDADSASVIDYSITGGCEVKAVNYLGQELVLTGAGGGGGGSVNFSAGTTSGNLASVVFSNSNGVSFGLNGSTITASGGGGITNINLSAGTTSQNLSAFVFSNSNNVSFGLNGSTVTGTVTVASTQGSINLSAGTTSNLASAFTFSNSNGVSFGLNGSTITGSHNALTSQSNQAASAANGSFTFQTVSFSNVNGVSFATAAGSAIQASVAAGATATGNLGAIAVNALTTYTSGTVVFSNSNGITFGTNAQTITASHNALTTQSNQQITLFATGNTTQSSTGTSNASSLIFRGSGAASVGITNGSVLIDVAAGAAAITQSIGMSTQTAGGATGGTTGYATGDDILYHFVPGSNITMSQSINGASGTLSIYGPAAGGGGVTRPGASPYDDFVQVVGQVGQASLLLDPQGLPDVAFDRAQFFIQNTNSSNSSGSHTLSFWFGVYTRNASSLSLHWSGSGSTALTHSGTAGSYSLYSGKRLLALTVPATTLTDNRYWIGFVSRTTSGGANGTYSNYLVSNLNTPLTGIFGAVATATAQAKLGQGFYSATTSGMPASIAFSEIQGTASLAFRFAAFGFGSGTA